MNNNESIYNINEHIVKELYNEFKGSERKKTVILDDGKKYLLKLSDPTRELHRDISYINNAFSEYLGCKVAQVIGLPVQNVILGNYEYKSHNGDICIRPACLCEDLRKNNEKLIEMDTISLSDYENEYDNYTFEAAETKISKIEDLDIIKFENFFYDMFILDTLIGNTDRHSGNWGILTDDNNTRICPIYDCGSSFIPLIGDNQLPLKNASNSYLSICSAIIDSNGNRINYTNYLSNITNDKVDNALLRLIPRINLSKINSIIYDTNIFSDSRKAMYTDFLKNRYEHILVPALRRIFDINNGDIDKIDDSIDLYGFYVENIKAIAELELYEKNTIEIYNTPYDVMKISNRYAIIVDKDLCTGLLPIRSNNNEIRRCITVLDKFDNLLIDSLRNNDDLIRHKSKRR